MLLRRGISRLSRHHPECETVYWGLYCGTERPDVERVMQRNNKVFVPTAPYVLALHYSLTEAFSNPTLGQEGGGQGYLPASG